MTKRRTTTLTWHNTSQVLPPCALYVLGAWEEQLFFVESKVWPVEYDATEGCWWADGRKLPAPAQWALLVVPMN